MPAKNSAKYISECLDTIISQTYTDWELIIVNDHSSDETEEILKFYSNKQDRISYYNNPGKGIIPALQKAYKESSGDFITRMDSDDLMTSRKLELFVTKLKLAGEGYLTTALVKYISDGHLGEGYTKYASWLNQLTSFNTNFSEIYKECTIPSPNWMVHRVDFELSGGFNSELYPEDYDLAFRFKASGLNLANINEITHLWRDHPSRASRNDENYSDNKFTKLKLSHFLDQDHDKSRALVLWGAGPKGKAIAKELSMQGIAFRWVCNNPKKIGHDIYGTILEPIGIITDTSPSQAIIAVSQQNSRGEIDAKINVANVQAFWFC